MKKPACMCLLAALAACLAGLAAGCAAVGERKGPPPTVACDDLVPPAAEAAPGVTGKHFVMNWMLLGPFTFKEEDFGGGHQQAAIDKEFMPGEGRLDGTQKPPPGAAWRSMRFTGGDHMGMIDLDAFYGGIEHAAAYAVAWLDCPQDMPSARLLVGSDDYIRIWVNGKLVHTYNKERRPGEQDQDAIAGVMLRKGPNRIVVKCVDVVLGWNFYFRLTDGQGRPIFVRPKL
ncbi:MAG: hypothetical protein FJ288_00315 [Planctomycetes bacterium]|nr:hypothetical protein [Planctomycetota bacterium]